MDARHQDSNLGSAEATKRALAASASKVTQQGHPQKPKGSEVHIVPHDLFGDKPAGSVHAPAMQAVLTPTSINQGSSPKLTDSTSDQPTVSQSASILNSSHAVAGSPADPATAHPAAQQSNDCVNGGPLGPSNNSTTFQSTASQRAATPADPATGGSPAESSAEDAEDAWSPDYEEFGDGTSDEVAIALAVRNFSTQASSRNASMLDATQRERIKNLIDKKPEVQGLLSHTLLVTVLPSVELATGQKFKGGRMSRHNAVDPSSRQFWRDLETLLLQVALPRNTEYEFIQTQKCKMDNKTGIPSVQRYKLMFESKACTSRILSSDKLKTFKGDYTLRFSYRTNDEVPAPFPGQPYHCPLIYDPLHVNGKTPVENGKYVDMLLTGGMNPKAFNGIQRGQTLRTDCDQVVKKHGFMELYFDPAMTANHGSQELGTGVVNLMEDYNCCISIPLHKITEPPSYAAWKDSDNFIHKRELMKSGDWCQYCWGPAHEKGFKCVYYNFCRSCLSFQPREQKYRDLKLNKHLCNYGITEMPDQKQRNTKKTVELVEQVFSEERTAQVKVLEQKADIVNSQAAILFQLKLKRKRESKAKAKAEAEKKFRNKKKKHRFQDE